MYCPNCNSNLMDGTKKCPFCGTEFNSNQNEQAQQSPYNNNNYNNNSYNNFGNNGNYNNFGNNNYYGPSNQPIVRTKSSPNTLGVVASIAMFIAIFLPFFTVSFGLTISASLIDGKDWIIFAPVAILGFIFSITKMNKGVLTVGIIAVILTVLEAINASELRVKSKMSSLAYLEDYWDELSDYLKISYAYGFYIMLAGAVLLLFAGIKGISDDKKLRSF